MAVTSYIKVACPSQLNSTQLNSFAKDRWEGEKSYSTDWVPTNAKKRQGQWGWWWFLFLLSHWLMRLELCTSVPCTHIALESNYKICGPPHRFDTSLQCLCSLVSSLNAPFHCGLLRVAFNCTDSFVLVRLARSVCLLWSNPQVLGSSNIIIL